MHATISHFSLHEANQAVNNIRQRVARIYQMNSLLKIQLRSMHIKNMMIFPSLICTKK